MAMSKNKEEQEIDDLLAELGIEVPEVEDDEFTDEKYIIDEEYDE